MWIQRLRMQISSRELITMLRGTLPGAAPVGRSQIETYIALIDREGVTARVDSESSQFLWRTADDFRQVWEPEITDRISTVDIYGADIPLINAFARLEGGRRQVVVFDGIRQVVLFYAHLITVLNLLQTRRPHRRLVVDGWDEEEMASFSLAGFSLLYEYMKNGHALIAVGDILGPIALQNTQHGYAATVAFLMAHELGHPSWATPGDPVSFRNETTCLWRLGRILTNTNNRSLKQTAMPSLDFRSICGSCSCLARSSSSGQWPLWKPLRDHGAELIRSTQTAPLTWPRCFPEDLWMPGRYETSSRVRLRDSEGSRRCAKKAGVTFRTASTGLCQLISRSA